MRWVFVTFIVCLAVAAANLVDESNSSDEEQNNIDIFLPKSSMNGGQGLDKTVRAFYYNYWLYPGISMQPRVSYVSPYMNFVEPLTFQDVFEKPVFVVTPSQYIQNTFSMFYLHNGLRTLHIHHAFSWLQEFFKHPGMKGLIFYPHLIYNVRFSNTPISSVTLPDDLRMSDFVSIQECNNGKIPYVFVAPEDLFDRMHFDNIAKVSDFKVYNDAIEVHPIVAQSRPGYEPFYGPQSPQASQGHQVAPPRPSGVTSESGSSVNTMDFGSDANQLIEPPQVLVKSERLVATQAGRGAYDDTGYAAQYGYGQTQGINGQYNVNYGQGQSGLNIESRMVNAAQASSNSYSQGVVLGTQVDTGAQVNAAYGASRNVYGALPGSKVGVESASMATSGAHGQSQNSAPAQNTGNVLRTDSGIIQGQQFTSAASTEGASLVGMSGQRSAAVSVSSVDPGNVAKAGSLSRADMGSTSPGQSAISFPKEGALESIASASVSRTGPQIVEYVTESQASGHSQAQSSGASLQGGNLVRSESAKYEGQIGAQGSVSAGLNSESISRTNSGGVEQVTETSSFSGSTGQPGKLLRSGGNFEGVGGEFGLSGNVGGKFGLSGSIANSPLTKIGNGIIKNIDVTTHGLGVDLLQHQGELEQHQKSGSISSSSSVSKSGVSSSNIETSTLSEPIKFAKPIISSKKAFVSSSRSLNEENKSADTLPPVMMSETIAA